MIQGLHIAAWPETRSERRERRRRRRDVPSPHIAPRTGISPHGVASITCVGAICLMSAVSRNAIPRGLELALALSVGGLLLGAYGTLQVRRETVTSQAGVPLSAIALLALVAPMML